MAYTLDPRPVSVVETPQFRRQAAVIWSEEELRALIDHVAMNPEAGDLIPGSGGVRKLRWQRQGLGKRGGARVIYFYHNQETPIFLLMAYAKSLSSDISPSAKDALAAFVRRLKHPTQH